MFTCKPFFVLCASLVAHHALAATDIAALRARLVPPPCGSFAAEFVTTYSPIADTAAAVANEHYARTRKACHVEGLDRQGRRVSFNGADLPACLMNSRSQPARFEVDERIDLVWPWFRLASTTQLDPALAAATEWRVWDPAGLAVWSERSGSVPRVTRTTSDATWDVAIGALGMFGRTARQVDYLCQVAEDQVGVEVTASGGLRMLIRLQDSKVLDGFDEMYLANGVMVTPGYAELLFEEHSGCSFLTATYRDCADATMLIQRMRWEGAEPMPREIEERCWVVGTGDIYRIQHVEIERLDGEQPTTSSLAWRPEPSQAVVDRRFAAELEYSADASGAVPLDAELAIRAESERRTAVEGERVDSESNTVVASGSQYLTLVEAPSFGIQPVGAEVRVPMTLSNSSGDVVRIDTPVKSCLVGDVILSDFVIGPGQSFPIEVRLTVADPMRNDYQLTIPFVRASAPSALEHFELAFALTGRVAADIVPKVARADRRIASRPSPSTLFELRGRTNQALSPVVSGPGIASTILSRRGVCDIRISGLDSAREVFGARRLPFEVREFEGCETASTATLIVERVPEQLAATWPGAVLALTGGFPRERRFEAPELTVHGAQLADGESLRPAHGQIELHVEEGRLLVRELAPPAPDGGLKWFTVALDTSLGPVELLVYSGPTHAQ
ncbi:MAG: hypothetical protein IT454_03245 [Planctomycetes bacterium]|nr:hypothetical protein [Planctomycetota bacterium]